ncbi:MAG: mannose-1-phosphate guanylyltransferase/mannose-6-phosphate isomerase [Proteobacteria bacterium]|nr:mannose-1-phosphate guanylyltransferase/mannose-6-phosphate isomerase [Pseudomonadota bacterium]
MLVPVIMAGGSGTRLWPLSREAYPKQFIPLFDNQSLFQQTLARLTHLPDCGMPIVVGNEQHRFLMAEQIRQSLIPSCSMILEPCFKGTAPAVALAAVHALAKYNQDVTLLVLAADHVMSDVKGFAASVNEAIFASLEGKLVTFGIRPTFAHTGFGYIQQGNALTKNSFELAKFVEKPDLKTAQKYLESQNYWWNSGMFLFSASQFLQELMLHDEKIFHFAKAAIENAVVDADFIRPDAAYFEACPTDSIDYAVMEKTMNGALVPLQTPWSDVGAFDALTELYPIDANGNVAQGDVTLQKSENCFVHSEQRLVAAVGVKDLIIVETADAVLVLDKHHAQDVKTVVNTLRDNARKEVTYHRRVSRPWGYFESIDEGDRFQVKRITVAVGQKLSLQRHHHRSEHWVVVKGTARVTRGEEIFLLSENQSTYIPIGVNHRLENVGKIPLEMIEVQSGAYLGEDDILRLEDQYGRLASFSEPVAEALIPISD